MYTFWPDIFNKKCNYYHYETLHTIEFLYTSTKQILQQTFKVLLTISLCWSVDCFSQQSLYNNNNSFRTVSHIFHKRLPCSNIFKREFQWTLNTNMMMIIFFAMIIMYQLLIKYCLHIKERYQIHDKRGAGRKSAVRSISSFYFTYLE